MGLVATLKCTLENFSPSDWELAFGAYVKANRSHWTGPPYEVVRDILHRKGRYEFGFQAMGTWHSRFALQVREDGRLEALFIRNPDLPGRMGQKLEDMERAFERELALQR